MPSSIGAPAPQVIVVEPHKRDWTIVRWCHKVADSVSRKFDEGSTFGKWLGRAVAAVFVPFGILPSLVGDAIHGIRGKDLSDRRVETTQAVEKKIPTTEEFAALTAEKEALKTDKEALLKRVSAAEADAKQAKLENEDLNTRAERQADALVRIAHEEKQELLKKAQDKFNKERESKVRCIRRQHGELKTKDAELEKQAIKLKFQEWKLKVREQNQAALGADLKNYKAVAIHYKNQAETFKKVAVDNIQNAFREATRSISTEKELEREQTITRYMAEELVKERQKTWQEKYLNDLFKDFSVKQGLKVLLAEENLVSCDELDNLDEYSVVKVEMNEDGKEPIFNLTVIAPGADKRVVSINLIQLNTLLNRMEQFDNELMDFGARVRDGMYALKTHAEVPGYGPGSRGFGYYNADEAESVHGSVDGEQPLSFDNYDPSLQLEQPGESLLPPAGQNGTGNQPGAEVSVDKQDSESVKANNGGEGE
ncbi:hypothetical protein [Endozoicomonas sp. GU-1]|uniref:hypothetical protein n=1 Tax=Endozoicomonas sp. GU-1 TaxID=3009078 RepID=UPI0022B4788B|nr:hypothetical protein [Endozoicomonas sp. GU-1]WBA80218.1 hypothetical protein O2T12_18010 [Endozoicomonas sp. GU-1]WBA87794.1 hypothetical protein O3276_07235 [Endozoicomonas sp. GU-1]